MTHPLTPSTAAPVHPDYPVRTKRLRLRPVRFDDLDAVHAHRSLPEVARHLPHEPHSREMTEQTLERMIGGQALAVPGDWLDLAVEDESGRVVGEVLLKRDEREPETGEVGFAFHPDVHGTGIATEAVTAALGIAFEDFGWHRVLGVCTVENVASAALMRRVGMRHEAVNRDGAFRKGAWRSFSTFAVLGAEWRGGPRPSADQRAVDAVVSAFFAAFTRRAGEPVRLDAARAALAPDAVVERVTEGGGLDRTGVDAFLAPRQILLNGDSLTDFTEIEVTSTTMFAAGRAHRHSLYHKWGVRDGAAFNAWGRKTLTLRPSAGSWVIESFTWADERESTGLTDQGLSDCRPPERS
ncbi:GNAT family N-acetyltransferase [Streptomyces sp. NPDC059442]|uniref:GNAT family N-acetyltransferase n=1 Tax=Streptomyces sp. NPDC059442 TaxID=3346830 RepID=UPI0036A67F12